MAKEIKPKIESALLPVDITSLMREWKDGEAMGEKSQISELDDVFRWMPGTINLFTGWANDGKGTFYDFLAVMNAKFDKKKFCMMKQEDISSTRYKNDPPKITANRIHKGLAWTLTGKTPYKMYAEKHHIPQVGRDEYFDALEFIEEHFKIIYPKDRSYKNVMDLFKFYYEKYGIDRFLIDPFKSLKLDDSKRTDFMMDDLFIQTKEFAVQTNSVFDFIAHPKTMTDVRVGKDKDAAFKIVTQFMVAGGAAWDNNMDKIHSIVRPERHLNPADPKVHFHTLKVRNSEETLIKRGSYENIIFDPKQRRYFFNGSCPIDGSMLAASQAILKNPIIDFTAPKEPELTGDELPF